MSATRLCLPVPHIRRRVVVALMVALAGQIVGVQAQSEFLTILLCDGEARTGAQAFENGVGDHDNDVSNPTDCLNAAISASSSAGVGTGSGTGTATLEASGGYAAGRFSVQLLATAGASASRTRIGVNGGAAYGTGGWRMEFIPTTNVLLTVQAGVDNGSDLFVGKRVGNGYTQLLHTDVSGPGTFELQLEAGETYEISIFAQAAASLLNIDPGNSPGGASSVSASLLFVPFLQPKLVALEVVQSIQDWKNSVPLIAGKRTFVRAFVEAADSADVGKPFTGRLIGRQGGTELAGSSLTPLSGGGLNNPATQPASARAARSNDVSNLAASLTFELPTGWCHNSVCLEFEGDGFIAQPVEPAEMGGTAGDGIVCVTFHSTPKPKIIGVPIGLNNVFGPPVSAPNLQQVTSLFQFARHMYPVEDFNWSVRSALFLSHSPASLNSRELLLAVATARALDNNTNLSDFYMGSVVSQIPGPSSLSSNTLGASLEENANAWTRLYPETTLPHEWGHLLYRHHAVHSSFGFDAIGRKQGQCGEVASSSAEDFPFYDLTSPSGPTVNRPLISPVSVDPNDWIYGFTRYQGSYTVKMPTNSFELMGYCEKTNEAWISSHTYAAIRSRFQQLYPVPAVAPGPLEIVRAASDDATLIIRGVYTFEPPSVRWLPFVCAPAAPPPLPEPGPFNLRVLDGNGGLLESIPLNIERADDDEDGNAATFLVGVPLNPAARRVELWQGGQFIGARDASANPPTAQVIAPVSGAVINTPEFLAQWQASDADGDPLTFVVQYSHDNGSTWNMLALDYLGENVAVPCDTVPGSAQARMRVLASDGFHCVLAESPGTFTVPDKGPVVVAVDPIDGAAYAESEPVVLAGYAYDYEEGRVPDGRLEWYSDRDGFLGSGPSLQKSAATFSLGEHAIRLEARDAQGNVSATTNRVIIRPFLAPRVRTRGVAADRLRLEIFGSPGALTVIEVSTNLADWSAHQTLMQGSRSVQVEVATPGNSAVGFYRTHTLPRPPLIPVPPASQAVLTGQTLTLSAGSPSRLNTYQWFFDGVAISGATSNALTFAGVQAHQSGSYHLVISNAAGAVTSSPALVTVMGAAYEVLHHFGTNSMDGINGWGPLIQASDGMVYGCARAGAISNSGVIFRMKLNGADYTVLHRFNPSTDGGTPLGGVIEGSDGRLYGTCNLGGTNNSGTVWRVNRDGSGFTVLRHLLSTGDCRNPSAPLIEASDAALYGTAYSGGGLGRGGVFRIGKDGSDYQIISGFNFGGAAFPRQPIGGVVEGGDGLLYGVTELGGSANAGAFYGLEKNGSNQVLLASFGVTAGAPANPEGTLLPGLEGLLFYGTSYAGGVSNRGAIFRVSTASGAVTRLYSAGADASHPVEPRSALISLPSGRLAGTSRLGGANNQGVVFDLTSDGGDLQVRHGFTGSDGDGARSRSPLLAVPGGVVYGVTFGGGHNDQGVIFRMLVP